MKSKAAVIVFLFTLISSWSLMSCAHSQENSALQLTGQTTAQFTIARMVIAADIQNREPVGASETFPSSQETVYCFVEATDIADDTEITFTWSHNEKEMHSIILPLKKGLKWRTFSSKNLYGQTGTWNVNLKDSSGNTVETVSFKVE